MNANTPLPARSRVASSVDQKTNAIKNVSRIDALIFVAATIVLAIVYLTLPGFKGWFAEASGYGWIPVIFWVWPVVVALRFRPRLLIYRYREVLIGAVVVAASLGIMSLIGHDSYESSSSGMAGDWGDVIGGQSLGFGIVKIIGICSIIPLLLFPKPIRTGMGYVVSWIASKFTHLIHLSFARLARWVTVPGSPSGFPRSSDTKTSKENNDISRPMTSSISGLKGFPDGVSEALERFAEEESTGHLKIKNLESAFSAGHDLPGIGLLSLDDSFVRGDEDFHDTARLIEHTLASHGMDVNVRDVQVGPRLVRFGLEPGWQNGTGQGRRVRVQSIVARETDIALALGIPGLRIQPIIPGQALIGIEVPVKVPRRIGLRSMMESGEFDLDVGSGGLCLPLGRDVGFGTEVVDLTQLPHLLVAGGTGSGKSVCLNAMVLSMLMTSSPDRLRMVMVDPKGVEFAHYQEIPHLVAPIINRPDEFGSALDSLILIMQQRYELLRGAGARDIGTYNRRPGAAPIPFLVVVVDELAELMLSGGKHAEDNLVRLAQQGRAAGIHLILSTQRPTVDVVTGLLKANISSRIAFSVPTQADSRVILDTGGAEKLLGKGDMLVVTGESRVQKRLQGAQVADEEIQRVVDFWLKPGTLVRSR